MDKKRQEKKEQFDNTQQKSSAAKILIIVAVVVLAGLAGFFVLTQPATDSIASVKSINGEVRIDLSQINDGQAHYFSFAAKDAVIPFFVIKSVDGVMRAAFDACDVCYREKKGYRQEGDQMVCNNCNMKFRSDLINVVKGGCNPAPLNRRIDGQQLVILDTDILKGAWYFGG